MRIINICKNDWSNFSFDNCMSLKSVGVDCRAYVSNAHKFNYSEQSEVINYSEFGGVCRNADIIQIFHSDVACLNQVVGLNIPIVVYHTGSGYRSEPDKLNNSFNPLVGMSFTALGELVGLGAKNERYVVGAIDTEKIQPSFMESNEVVFAHYPSKTEVKGTAEIVEMMKEIGKRNRFVFNYNDSELKFNYTEQQLKMRKCDIYIELLKPELNGKKYGSWGITALEAAAMGKIVVTQNLSENIYKAHYGNCPFVLIENKDDFIKKINWLLSLTKSEIKNMQLKTRKWVEEKHSYKSTGNYILKHLEKIYAPQSV